MAIARVASRVQSGGHRVPDDVVRRRYAAGLKNFFTLYRPIVDAWQIFDNSGCDGYELIAQDSTEDTLLVENETIWERLVETYQ